MIEKSYRTQDPEQTWVLEKKFKIITVPFIVATLRIRPFPEVRATALTPAQTNLQASSNFFSLSAIFVVCRPGRITTITLEHGIFLGYLIMWPGP